ncbi:hypothetical protein [Cellulomonas soli]
MIELPEAAAFAAGLQVALAGRTVLDAQAGGSPHRFAFYSGEPGSYRARLRGRVLGGASAAGGLVLIDVGEDEHLLLGDGAYPRLHAPGARVPDRHQLRLDLDDGSVLTVGVQMYGGLHLVDVRDPDPYLAAALRCPSPLAEGFDDAWVAGLWAQDGVERGSVKAFLATHQRIPGLGNGVLQDICWQARVHPRRAVLTLDAAARAGLIAAARSTLAAMVAGGGRDTERDLRGAPVDVPGRCGVRVRWLPGVRRGRG